MTPIEFIAIISAMLMLAIAVVTKQKCRHLSDEVKAIKAELKMVYKEKAKLLSNISQLTEKDGVSKETVLAIAGEITRMENNLYHMEEVSGRRQLIRALDRMKASLQTEDFTIVSLLGCPYQEGMNIKAVFVEDQTIPPGSSIIVSVKIPQVNHGGRMIQAASVTVGQNNL